MNNHTDPVHKLVAMDFCSFAASRNESIRGIIPNASDSFFNGQDPFRESLLDVNLFVSQGYEESASQQAIDTIRSSLSSQNVVTDIRFPTALDIYEVLDQEFHDYLNLSRLGLIPESSRNVTRVEVARRINNKWEETISSYDSQVGQRASVLEVYQRNRGVFVPKIDLNQIHRLRSIGYAMASIIIMSSLILGTWSIVYRAAPVVRSSQPVFLVMICVGAIVFGSAIFPMGIDDSFISPDGVSRACISIPWLLALGWTILFSGLFAKLRRVNIVFRNAAHFRRTTVTHKDVLLPVRSWSRRNRARCLSCTYTVHFVLVFVAAHRERISTSCLDNC